MGEGRGGGGGERRGSWGLCFHYKDMVGLILQGPGDLPKSTSKSWLILGFHLKFLTYPLLPLIIMLFNILRSSIRYLFHRIVE